MTDPNETPTTTKEDLAGDAIGEILAVLETHPHVVNVKVKAERAKALVDELLAHRREKAIPLPHQSPQQLLETITAQHAAAHAALMMFLTRMGGQLGHITEIVMSAAQPQEAKSGETKEEVAAQAPA